MRARAPSGIRRYWWTAFLVVGAVLFWIVLRYAHLKFASLTHDPATEVMPSLREARPVDFPVRELDLGYLQVSLPASFTGQPLNVEASGCIQIHHQNGTPAVTFMSLWNVVDAGFGAIIDGIAEMTGAANMGWYDVQHLALHAAPFDLWDIPFIGIRETQNRLTLLMIKRITIRTAIRARIVEVEGLAMIILTFPEWTEMEVFDRKRSSMQVVYIEDNDELAERTIDALIASYRITTDDLSEGNLATLIENAGIASTPRPGAPMANPSSTVPLHYARARMQKAGEEIRQRRASAQEDGSGEP